MFLKEGDISISLTLPSASQNLNIQQKKSVK